MENFSEVEASLERAGRVEELIRLYEGRAREVALPAEAARLLCRAAELAWSRTKSFSRAEALLRRALVVDGESREALLGLKTLYQHAQDALSLTAVLEQLAATASGSEAAELYVQA